MSTHTEMVRSDPPLSHGSVRAFGAKYTANGRTLASLARDYTEEAIDLLVAVLRGQYDAKTADRIKAADILLDRGWGKAKETVELTLPQADVSQLSRDQLRAIAMGAIIEGEVVATINGTTNGT